jgi:acetate kinase
MPLSKQKVAPHILTINCGSSSIKVSLFFVDQVGVKECRKVYDATLRHKGTPQALLQIRTQEGEEKVPMKESTLKAIIEVINARNLLDTNLLLAIGHRFVHGGERYIAPEKLTSDVIADLEKLSSLAPLHNPACLEGIREAMDLFGKDIPQYAVFDTSFSATMPSYAQHYAIPYELSTKYGIRRYGFHGIAHNYLYQTYRHHSVQLGTSAKVITIHLGHGCSMAAIKDGVCMDTSMGFTPAEGLVMATRAGDVDAAILPFLCEHLQKSVQEVMNLLNNESGLLGVSKTSSSMEDLLKLSSENHLQARLAIDIFCYRIVKYIGAYLAALGGVEAIIFSGGIGENAYQIRERITADLAWYGVKIALTNNQRAVGLKPGDLHKISAVDSSVDLYVIAADENASIAQQVSGLG